MLFGVQDKVRVEKGVRIGMVGTVSGCSQIHRNSKPDTPTYTVHFPELAVQETYKEDQLSLVQRYDRVAAEAEAKAKREAARAEAERLSDLKMEEALRKKIMRELEIREQVEAEFAAKKANKET